HAGLVNICGVALDVGLEDLRNAQHIDLSHWNTIANSLLSKMSDYGTFQRLVRDLTEESAQRIEAMVLYRSMFLGNTVETNVPVNGVINRSLAGYLAALGVINPGINDRENNKYFTISSPLMDSFIRQTIIPAIYPNAPKTQPPLKFDGTLDILAILKLTLTFFDKEQIDRAHTLSSKVSRVYVDQRLNQIVPRES
ncbi:hypothetical protein BGZ76_007732, partial [Entomortierella beljakovae]